MSDLDITEAARVRQRADESRSQYFEELERFTTSEAARLQFAPLLCADGT